MTKFEQLLVGVGSTTLGSVGLFHSDGITLAFFGGLMIGIGSVLIIYACVPSRR